MYTIFFLFQNWARLALVVFRNLVAAPYYLCDLSKYDIV